MKVWGGGFGIMRLEGALLLASLNRITFLAPLRLAFLVSPATGRTS
jgi:hypothetical protein